MNRWSAGFWFAACVLASTNVVAQSLPARRAAPLSASPSSAAPTGDPRAPPSRVTQFALPNGLRVVLDEDHRVPLVAVHVRYRIGLGVPHEGPSGLPHLTEHLLYEGTPHIGSGGFFAAIGDLGANRFNGVTALDDTSYHEIVPSGSVDRALWMEAERMAFGALGVTQQALDRERRLVAEELQTREAAQPGMSLGRLMRYAMYPAAHPYRGGEESATDLAGVSVADVQHFVQRWYAPGNASLAVVGDFDTTHVRAAVERWFGAIRAHARGTAAGGGSTASLSWRPVTGPTPTRAVQAQELPDSVGGILTGSAATQSAMVSLIWHSPALWTTPDAELDIFAAVLQRRLQARLVDALGIATSVRVVQASTDLSSNFVIQVEVRSAMDAVLQNVRNEIFPERVASIGETEFAAGRARFLGHALASSESLENRASFAAHDAWLMNGYGGALAQSRRYASLTREGVVRTASTWITPARAFVLAVRSSLAAPHGGRVEDFAIDWPGARLRVASPADAATTAATAPIATRPTATAAAGSTAGATATQLADVATPLDALGPAPAIVDAPPRSAPSLAIVTLRNRLGIVNVHLPEAPRTTVAIVNPWSTERDPSASTAFRELVMDGMIHGTRAHPGSRWQDAADALGVQSAMRLVPGGTHLAFTFASTNLASALPLVAETLVEPEFSSAWFDARRDVFRARWREQAGFARSVHPSVVYAALMGSSHPRARRWVDVDDEPSLWTLRQVTDYFASRYSARGAVIVVAGPHRVEQIAPLLEPSFGRFANVAPPIWLVAAQPASDSGAPGVYLTALASSARGTVSVVWRTALQDSNDEPTRRVIQTLLSDPASSRLMARLRRGTAHVYAAGGDDWSDESDEAVGLTASVAVDQVGAAVREMLAEPDRLANSEVPADQLARAIRSTRAGLAADLQSSELVALRIARDLALNRRADTAWSLDARVRDVTPAVVRTFARERLRRQDARAVVAASLSRVAHGLLDLGLGPVRVVDVR